MKDILEYHPNGYIKHKIYYYDNGCKYVEEFYDENGLYHREDNLPAHQRCSENNMITRKIYIIHGIWHHICSPASICFHENGKINWKSYYFNNINKEKLTWMNLIKNI